MNVAQHTANTAPVSLPQAQQTPNARLPTWVARLGHHEGQHGQQPDRAGRAVAQGAGVGTLLRLLRDPQSWITAIAVLTLVGLSGGAFESEEAHSERSALHLHSGMTNDAVVAELSSSQR